MLDDPHAGRGIRAPERSRMLVATENGVFLWPATPLVYRVGNGFFAAEPRAVNSAIGCFFGPAALDLPIQTILERARDDLRNGRSAAVQGMLDKLCLPPLWPNGARLVRAVAERQNLVSPKFSVATQQDGTTWDEHDVATFASLYDGVSARARELAKIFNPGALNPRSVWDPDKHPRHRPANQTEVNSRRVVERTRLSFRSRDRRRLGTTIRQNASAIHPKFRKRSLTLLLRNSG